MAKLDVRWTKQALDDLNSARNFIILEYSQHLDQTIESILVCIDQLTKFPEIGREGRVRGTRELVIAKIPFILVYRKSSFSIEIISLLHQSRKWP